MGEGCVEQTGKCITVKVETNKYGVRARNCTRTFVETTKYSA